MNINISKGTPESTSINNSKKMLIAGPAVNDFKSKEIVSPKDKQDAYNMYGDSELYHAYCILADSGITNVYTANCYNYSDYILIIDKVLHYDFDYYVPINIYFRDKFYNAIEDRDMYYSEYALTQLTNVNSITTVIMTEKHASLYEDFDHYLIEMRNIEAEFINSFSNASLLDTSGNNLNLIYNNLKNIPYANIVLAALYMERDYAKYFENIKDAEVVFDMDNTDLIESRSMYFKYNYFTRDITIENTFNFRKTFDIYSNALIDDVIKRVIKSINIDKYKGKLYNQYISIQIETEIKKSLNNLKGKLFKDYKINNIKFKKTEPTAGYIAIDYSIVPYGTLENLNIVMGV